MNEAFRLSLGVVATSLLLGCNQAEPAANDAATSANVAVAAPITNTPAPAATPATAAAVAADGVTADYMVGKWSAMNEDCADTLEFRKDGTVVTPIGDAKWALNGDKLAVDFGEGSKTDPTTIKVLGPDRIEITKGSGKKETQKRC